MIRPTHLFNRILVDERNQRRFRDVPQDPPQQFREWRQARAQRFSNWRKDVVGRFTQRGWIETQAEVTSCKPLRTHYYSNQAYASLGGWAVTFNYYVDGKTYDGITVSP